MRLVLASRNDAKVRELARILGDLPLRIETLRDHPSVPALREDGDTYEANAIAKATAVAAATGCAALADDSGIEIDALGGAPGVRSARFLGEDATDDDRNREILRRLAGLTGDARSARYRAVVAIARPGGPTRTFAGDCAGRIVESPRGRGGFGYDPIFSATDDGRTVAELSADEKDRVSHRGAALRLARAYLKELFAAAPSP
jgi:XTP/dITP diphosphohydrolase